MKKIILIAAAAFILAQAGTAKELSGNDLKAVNAALDTKLYSTDYTSFDKQMEVVKQAEEKIASYGTISEEAALICRNVITLQKETLKSQNQMMKSDKKDLPKDPQAKATAEKCLEEYNSFAKTHSDLSPQFKMHWIEAEMATLSYMSKAKQLAKAPGIIDKYKELDKAYPNYGESLLVYGMILYMMPKIAGGDKEAGMSKLKRATQTGTSNYEKVSSMILYSQMLFEEKQFDEARKYLEKAKELAPQNKTINFIKAYNDSGKSAFGGKAIPGLGF